MALLWLRLAQSQDLRTLGLDEITRSNKVASYFTELDQKISMKITNLFNLIVRSLMKWMTTYWTFLKNSGHSNLHILDQKRQVYLRLGQMFTPQKLSIKSLKQK